MKRYKVRMRSRDARWERTVTFRSPGYWEARRMMQKYWPMNEMLQVKEVS